mgnify:CR=1 FL=1|jgi:hypothetical protein
MDIGALHWVVEMRCRVHIFLMKYSQMLILE